jgi:hypothetical protein
MSTRCKARAIVALAAAYGLAAQAVLLAIGGPVGGGADFASSLCSASQAGASHPAPDGKDHDCPALCAACCCSAPIVPSSAAAAAVSYAQVTASLIAGVPANAPTWRFHLDRAHRSRAPPLG